MAKKKSRVEETDFAPLIVSGIVCILILVYAMYSAGWLSNGTNTSATDNVVASGNTTFYTSSLANVRSCASTDCDVMGQYPAGTKFDLSYTADTLPEWVQVSWSASDGSSKSGYINKTVLTTQTDTTFLGANTPTPSGVSQPTTPLATDLPSIVKEWSPRVVRIVCSDSTYISSGTGVLTRMDFTSIGKPNAPTLITNKHVITDSSSGALYSACNFAAPGVSQYFPITMSIERELTNEDVAYFPSSMTNPPPGAATAMKVCKSTDAGVGDRVAILGYPVNGGTGDVSKAITLTDGIISSYDGEYYVTDAKIDHGNSGGA